MSRFNTGNQLDSDNLKDLSDNAKNIDLAANSSADTFQDRLGRSRLTWAGMENQFESDQSEREVQFESEQTSRDSRFNDFIASSGYQFVGDYAPGIEITEYNQLVRDSTGELWRVSGQVELPYVTTGAGIPEGDALVPAGDAVLRQDLASPGKGALMVRGAVIYVNTIADLQSLDASRLVDGQTVRVSTTGRAGFFVWTADDRSGEVAQDPLHGVWAPIDADPSGVSGAFNRMITDHLTPEMFGYIENQTNDGEVFSELLKQSSLNRTTAYFGSGSYDFNFSEPISADAFRIVGDDAKINIAGWDNIALYIQDGFYLDGVNFTTSDTGTTSFLFYATAPVNHFEIGKTSCCYEGVSDGSDRIRGFIRGKGRRVVIGEILVSGVTTGAVFESTNLEPCESFKAGNLLAENAITGFYLSGGTSGDLGAMFGSVSIDYLSIVNTPEQQSNYSAVPGADGLLIEGYKETRVGYVYSERPVERAIYANAGVGPFTCQGYTLNYSSGIKACGKIDDENSIDVRVIGVEIGPGIVRGGSLNDSFGRAVTIYDAEDVNIGVVNMRGYPGEVDGLMECGVLLQRTLRNVCVHGVVGQYIRNAPVIIHQQNASKITRDSHMDNIHIKGISVIDPSIAAPRHLIDYSASPGITSPRPIRNLRITNCYGKSTTEYGVTFNQFDVVGYRAVSRLLGLIKISGVSGLYTKGNRIDGYSLGLAGFIEVGALSDKVVINEEMHTPSILGALNDTGNSGNSFLRFSSGSKVDFMVDESHKGGVYVVEVLAGKAGYGVINQSRLESSVRAQGSLTLAEGQGQGYPINSSTLCSFHGSVSSDDGGWIDFYFDGVTVIKKSGSSNFLASNTPGSHCIYPTANEFILRNRTGAARRYWIAFSGTRTQSA